jgi:hypothetical protein
MLKLAEAFRVEGAWWALVWKALAWWDPEWWDPVWKALAWWDPEWWDPEWWDPVWKALVPLNSPPQKTDTSRSHNTDPRLYLLRLTDRNKI